MVFHKAKAAFLDRLVLIDGTETFARLRLKMHSQTSSRIFCEVIMMTSDLQIVNGIAVLVSGLYAYVHGASVYHWKMVIRVAWFSTITHLAALTCLRSYLHQHRFKRGLRLFLMLCLALMLAVAISTTVHITPNTKHSPAICFAPFRKDDEGYFNSWFDYDVPVSITLVVYNVGVRLLKLHRASSTKASVWLHRIAARILQPVASFLAPKPDSSAGIRGHLLWHMAVVQPFVASLIVVETYYFLFTSMAGEVYWLLLSMLYGTFDYIFLRDWEATAENDWSFGQILPCVMFFTPILVLLDTSVEATKISDDLPAGKYNII
ncbi:hypothetical protein OQA88_11538 [Cercophora sp. LCS_1]